MQALLLVAGLLAPSLAVPKPEISRLKLSKVTRNYYSRVLSYAAIVIVSGVEEAAGQLREPGGGPGRDRPVRRAHRAALQTGGETPCLCAGGERSGQYF